MVGPDYWFFLVRPPDLINSGLICEWNSSCISNLRLFCLKSLCVTQRPHFLGTGLYVWSVTRHNQIAKQHTLFPSYTHWIAVFRCIHFGVFLKSHFQSSKIPAFCEQMGKNESAWWKRLKEEVKKNKVDWALFLCEELLRGQDDVWKVRTLLEIRTSF